MKGDSNIIEGRCCVCGAIIDKSRIYCSEHRQWGREHDRKIFESATLDQVLSIVEAIFYRARVDYLCNTADMRADAEEFFRSPWAQRLSLSYFDPDAVIQKMDEEIEHGIDRTAIYFDI